MANEIRLIDANAKELMNRININFGCVQRYIIKSILKDAPTVDAVEVVHARWKDNTDENGFLRNAWRKCSACGGLNCSKRPPYCPNCGAKMDGGDEDG